MATLRRKKKSVATTPVIIAEIKRDQDLEVQSTALGPDIYSTHPLDTQKLLALIDFVNVTDSKGPSQSPS